MSQDWNITSRGAECSATGIPFADGSEVYSRLRFTEEGYVRDDFFMTQWNESLRENAVSVWKGVYLAPAPSPEEPLKKENAENLLRKLIETEEEENRNVIYILAVMLERKRILAERDVHNREDGVKIRVYEHKKSGEMFLIPDPELKLATLESVQQEVVDRLGGGGVEGRTSEVEG